MTTKDTLPMLLEVAAALESELKNLINHLCSDSGFAKMVASKAAIDWKKFPSNECHLSHVISLYEEAKLKQNAGLCGVVLQRLRPAIQELIRRASVGVDEAQIRKLGALIPCHSGGTFENDPLDAIIDAAIRAIRPHLAPVASGWMPIDSAPDDGTSCLIAALIVPSKEAAKHGAKPFWDITIGSCYSRTLKGKKWTSVLGSSPTHWMPLPQPPQAKGAG